MDQIWLNVACPECKAELTPDARFCWLCGAPAVKPPQTGIATSSIAPAELPPPSAGESPSAIAQPAAMVRPLAVPRGTFNPTSLVLLVAVAAVLAGVWQESPGLAILIAFLIGPPLLVTYLKSWSRELKSRRQATIATVENRDAPARAPHVAPMTSGEKAATFFTGLAITAGTVGVIAGAAAIYALVLLASMFFALLQLCTGKA